MVFKLVAFLILVTSPLLAQCSNTAYGSFTCVQTCTNFGFASTSIGCAFGSNVTSGNSIYIIAGATAGNMSFSSCAPVTLTTRNSETADSLHATGVVGSTASCTINAVTDSAGSIMVLAVEIAGPDTSAIDGSGISATGFVGTSGTISAASLTTTANGDFVVGGFSNSLAVAGNTFTAGGSAALLAQSASFGIAITGIVQSSAGSITMTATSADGNFNGGAGAIAFKAPSAAAPVLRRRSFSMD